MPAYRYLLGNVLTGTLLAEVPFEAASYSHVLDAPGAFSGTLALKQPAKLEGVLKASLALGRNSLYVERDGTIVWGGMLWTRDDDLDAGTLVLRGEGWHSYFRRRVLRAKKTYLQQDQTTGIAKNLIDTAQAVAGGSIGVVTADVAATGVLRDRVYEAFERKWIGEAVEQLAAVDGGFDFRYESRWSGSTLQTRFLTSYPATGRQTALTFDVGGPVADLGIKTDGTTLATNVDAVGAGEGDLALLATVQDPALLASYPVLDDVVSFTDVNDFPTLDGHARKRLQRGRAPIVIPKVIADPALEPVLGSYIAGDIVRVRGGYGLASIDTPARITSYEVTVDDRGGEAVELTFAGLEAFA